MKKLIISVVVLAAIAAGFLLYYEKGDKEEKFKTIPVTTGSIRATVTATGTVNAVTTVQVGTQVSGAIQKLCVDYNSHVKKGQVIAYIDPASFQAQVDQAKANLLMAQANMEKARATLLDSRRTRDRNRELFSKNLIARSDLDTAEATHDANDAALRAAEAQIAQNRAALRLSETNLAYTKIVSPVDGIVVSRSVDVGQTVAASFQTPTLFTIAQDLTKMQIDTSVDEADIGKVVVGNIAEFFVDAYPDRTFKGVVDQIRIAPTTVQNVVTYDVVIKVDNQDMVLKPGMTANVSIVIAQKEDVLKLPNAALRFKPTQKEGTRTPGKVSKMTAETEAPPHGKPIAQTGAAPKKSNNRMPGPRTYTVWVLKDNKPVKVAVTIGISDGSFTEVTSGALSEGQEVITESLTAAAAKNNNGSQQGPPRFMH